MFTGIVEAVGRIAALDRKGRDARVRIDAPDLDPADVKIGDSISISGVCLTVVQRQEHGFTFDVSAETLNRTTFSGLHIGDRVNLEKALLPTTRLGGHLVSGHVDGKGKVLECSAAGDSVRFRIEAPSRLAKYIAEKGSICVDGVSLTVNEIAGSVFGVNLVPHTLKETTLGELKRGCEVNLEVDILARYLERLLRGEQGSEGQRGITTEFLARHGFDG